MKSVSSKAVVLASLMLICLATSAEARVYLDVREVTMSLSGEDAVFEVEYDLNLLAKLYVLTLGSRYIEPELMRLFSGFDNVKIAKTKPDGVILVANGAGQYKDGYYLFESKPLGTKVPKFTVIYPGGFSRTLYKVAFTPSVFCEA